MSFTIDASHSFPGHFAEEEKKNLLRIFVPFFQGRVITAVLTNSSFSFKLLSL